MSSSILKAPCVSTDPLHRVGPPLPRGSLLGVCGDGWCSQLCHCNDAACLRRQMHRHAQPQTTTSSAKASYMCIDPRQCVHPFCASRVPTVATSHNYRGTHMRTTKPIESRTGLVGIVLVSVVWLFALFAGLGEGGGRSGQRNRKWSKDVFCCCCCWENPEV